MSHIIRAKNSYIRTFSGYYTYLVTLIIYTGCHCERVCSSMCSRLLRHLQLLHVFCVCYHLLCLPNVLCPVLGLAVYVFGFLVWNCDCKLLSKLVPIFSIEINIHKLSRNASLAYNEGLVYLYCLKLIPALTALFIPCICRILFERFMQTVLKCVNCYLKEELT